MNKNKNIRISLVSSLMRNEYDDKLKNVFSNMLSFIKDENIEFNFNGIDLLNLSYNFDPYILNKNCIVSLTPSKYLLCKDSLSDKINSILTVKKVYQERPYFPAYFIVNKNSEITDINSHKIKRIFLVSVDSTSGYIAPLNKLYEQGVIKTPNERGIREKGWEMILVGNQRDVESEIITDKEAIGATGQFENQDDPNKSFVTPILSYYNLPQDVIVISRNLLPYRNSIINWFMRIFEKDANNKYLYEEGEILSKSSTRISGVFRIDLEFENILKNLQTMIKRVNSTDETKESSHTIYKIFLASSEELRAERDDIEIFMSRENNQFIKNGFYFELIRWENFIDAMSKNGLQSEYNKAVKNCDIFLSLFFTKVGTYTLEEFETALDQFKKTGKPYVYTYFKNASVKTSEISREFLDLLNFKEELRELGHFETYYENTNDLLFQIKKQLDKILPNL